MASSLVRFPSRGIGPVLAKHAPASAEQKSVPVLTYPAQLFFGLTDENAGADQLRGMNAYRVMWLVYACMRYRATKLNEPPLWIRRETPKGEEWLPLGDHPLAQLLDRPNPDQTMPELLEQLSLYLDGGGRALLVKNRDRGKRVASLYAFAREEFTVEPANGRLYGRFRVATREGARDLGPDDVIFFRETDPMNVWEGLGTLDVALAHANIGHEMRRAISAALRNTIRPGGVIEADERLAQPDFDRLKAEMQAMYGGVVNTGKLMLLEKAKLQQLDRSLKDLELGPVQGDVEAAICGAFAIHPALIGAKVGLENSSGFADTIKPAIELFYDRVVFPRWGTLEERLTQGLLREVDSDVTRWIRFDREKVRALQADLEKRAKEAVLAQCFWSIDEQRVHTNREPLNDERGKMLGAELRALRAAAAAPQDPAKEQPASGAKGREVKSLAGRIRRSTVPDVETQQALWRAADAKATAAEAPYRQAAIALFATEQRELDAFFAAGRDEAKAAPSRPPLEELEDAFVQAALALIRRHYGPTGRYHQAWLERYQALVEQTFAVAGAEMQAELGISFTLENPRVQTAIVDRAERLATFVTGETAKQITQIISEGRAAGLGINAIADRINEEVFGGQARVRAERIARTETIGAMNQGEYLSAVASGVLRSKSWLTQDDAKVRPTHVKNGELAPIALDARYPNGLLFPGDPAGTAEELINCRCSLLFYTEDPS